MGVGCEMEGPVNFQRYRRGAIHDGDIYGEQLVERHVLVLMHELHGVEAGRDVAVQLGDDDVGGLLLPRLCQPSSEWGRE